MGKGNLKAAVIGVGYLGRFHAQKYALIPGVDLAYVVDAEAKRAAEVADEFGAEWTTDFTEILEKVDIASIVVPTQAHFDVTRTFLEAGVHILLEKPMTVTLEEADRLIELADAGDLVLQIGHLKRFHPAVVAMRSSGRLNSPRIIESIRLAPFKPRALDVDVVLDLMIHDVDLILNFVQSEVESVDAVGAKVVTDQIDVANARLKFANGCVAQVTASRVARDAIRRIRVIQDCSLLSIDFIRNDIMAQRRGEGTQIMNGIEVPKIEETFLPIEPHDILEAEIRSFCEAVTAGHPPLVSGREGRKALEVVMRIQESIQVFRDALPPAPPSMAPGAFQ